MEIIAVAAVVAAVLAYASLRGIVKEELYWRRLAREGRARRKRFGIF